MTDISWITIPLDDWSLFFLLWESTWRQDHHEFSTDTFCVIFVSWDFSHVKCLPWLIQGWEILCSPLLETNLSSRGVIGECCTEQSLFCYTSPFFFSHCYFFLMFFFCCQSRMPHPFIFCFFCFSNIQATAFNATCFSSTLLKWETDLPKLKSKELWCNWAVDNELSNRALSSLASDCMALSRSWLTPNWVRLITGSSKTRNDWTRNDSQYFDGLSASWQYCCCRGACADFFALTTCCSLGAIVQITLHVHSETFVLTWIYSMKQETYSMDWWLCT